MRKSFFNLVPKRYSNEQFMKSIGERNRWLIKLRYGAIALLLTLVVIIYIIKFTVQDFHFEPWPLLIVSACIFLYNLLFARISNILDTRRKSVSNIIIYNEHYKFHDLHFSLIQIVTDFLALLFFIHYTGGVETPLIVFFVFHIIIGSLILPGPVIFSLVGITYLITAFGAFLEYKEIIPHYSLGLYNFELYNNPIYLFIYFFIYGITLFTATYLANSIAKELYERENKLAKTLHELGEAEKTKSKYVMSIVHDLKTPIAAATTYISMLLDGNLGELTSAVMKPLERSKIRLTNAINTINDILHISQLKAESNIEDIEIVDLIDVFNQINNEFRVLILSKKINYSFVYSDKDKYQIQAEPQLIKLALSNLVSNAIKYTEENGMIEIQLEESRNSVTISIADDGIGIPEDEIEKIFTNFYRTSISKAKGIEGTGLGLSFVNDIIKRYNGSIQVISPSNLNPSKNSGTKFILNLPKLYNLFKV